MCGTLLRWLGPKEVRTERLVQLLKLFRGWSSLNTHQVRILFLSLRELVKTSTPGQNSQLFGILGNVSLFCNLHFLCEEKGETFLIVNLK